MYTGVIVKNSLADPSFLHQVEVLNTWTEGSWELYKVHLTETVARTLSQYLNDGPWYVHFWHDDREHILVIFKNAYFNLQQSDMSTWQPAIQHGLSLGIPEEQLDFLIDQDV